MVADLLLQRWICEQSLVLILDATHIAFVVQCLHLVALTAASLNQATRLCLLVGILLWLIDSIELVILDVWHLLNLNWLAHVLKILLQLLLLLVLVHCRLEDVILLSLRRLRGISEIACLHHCVHLDQQ